MGRSRVTPALTARQLNRSTLARQLLLRREKLTVVDAVQRITALQAQQPVSPYIALWNRVVGFDPSDLDKAFADRALIKATLMRITLHAVTADDYSPFQRAMLRNLRASRLNDRRFKSTGLTVAAVDELVPPLLALLSRPHTRGEIEEMLAERLGREPDNHVFWALRTYAPLLHAPTDGPWSFAVTAPSYQAAPLDPAWADPGESLQHLIWRYLEGFGPASASDFAQFAMQRQTDIKPALERMADRLVTLKGPSGAKLLDVPDGLIPEEDTPASPRLLPMWDSILLAYRDRGRIIPESHRKLVIRRNGDVLPAVLVDGYVAGVWRPVDDGIEVTAFGTLAPPVWDELASEAAGLFQLLQDRETLVYSRYSNWWAEMPGERRTLPG